LQKKKTLTNLNDIKISTKKFMIKNKTTAVICTYNSENNIEECLRSLKKNEVNEIIIVDAKSSDNTIFIAKKYSNKILQDKRKGLGNARNIGIKKSSGKYILNFGPDNILPKGSLKIMIECLEKSNIAGVGAQTEVLGRNYFSWSMNLYKRARFYYGEREVVGTPTLFHSNILKKYLYNKKSTFSDDAELCNRLKKFGYKFWISRAIVFERKTDSLIDIIKRWKMYGISDYEIYLSNKKRWNFFRKANSIFYPLKEELIKPFLRTPIFNNFIILPFLMLITILRYYFWILRYFK
jgi:glycosyltransferase involved in cell wall biosynthesis